MIEELYLYKITGNVVGVKTLMDIGDVNIVRNYVTPFFSSPKNAKNDTTYNIKLPFTANNDKFFELCRLADINSFLPYDYIFADYFYKGMNIFVKAKAVMSPISDGYEIQCVYGVDRGKYLSLHESKLNEIDPLLMPIVYNENDWVVNWRKGMNLVTSGEYKYLSYISGERTLEVETDVDGLVLDKEYPKEPYLSNMKEMTWHPFISLRNVFELSRQYVNEVFLSNISPIIFQKLYDRLSGYGIILNGIESKEKTISTTINLNPLYPLSNDGLSVSIFDGEDLSRWVDPNKLVEDYGSVTYISKFSVSNMFIGEAYPIKLAFTFNNTKLRPNNGKIFLVKRDNKGEVVSTTDVIQTNQYTDTHGAYGVYSGTFEFLIESIDSKFTYSIEFDNTYSNVIAGDGGSITISLIFNKSFYNLNSSGIGHYDCVSNLPKVSAFEFLQNMLILACGFIGYDANGDIKIYYLDSILTNIQNKNVYNWTGRISNVDEVDFRPFDVSRKNYLKFNNDNDLTDRKGILLVDDKTLAVESDFETILFDSPLGTLGDIPEYILYEQSIKRVGDGVSFENKYKGDSWAKALVFDLEGEAKNLNIKHSDYLIYEKLLNYPKAYKFRIPLGVYESANIDFTKPAYVGEFGCNCLILSVLADNEGMCEVKVLLINKTLV